MGKPELGEKRTCSACATRFYDLRREPAVCVKCGALQVRPVRAMPASRRSAVSWAGRGPAARVPEAAEAAVAEAEPDAEEDEEDEDGVPEPIDADDDDPAAEVDGVR